MKSGREAVINNLFNLLPKKADGFSLVELLIGLTILLIIVFAFTPLFLGSIQRIMYAGDKSEAVYEGQADMEVKIVEKDTIDGYEVEFDFGEGVTVTVPGGIIDVEKSEGSASAWLNTFLPYIPSIQISPAFIYEGYDASDFQGFPVDLRGRDTQLDDSDYVYIYTSEEFEAGGSTLKELSFEIIEVPEDSDFDEYARFYLPTGSQGLTNAKSHYVIELRYSTDGIDVIVRSRLQVLLPSAVTVGSAGEVVVSPDANTIWNPRTTNISSTLNDFIWNGYKYIGVTEISEVVSWDDKSEPILKSMGLAYNKAINSIVQGNDLLVAVGDDGTIAISNDDGEQWAQITTKIDDEGQEETLSSDINLNAVGYNGNEFIAVGDAGTVLSSNNGLDWYDISIAEASLEDFLGIAYNNVGWMIVGTYRPAEPSNHKYLIYTLIDGNYSELEGSGNTALKDVAYGSIDGSGGSQFEGFVAVGRNGRVMTLKNGETEWVTTSVTSNTLNSVEFSMNIEQFVIVGDSGTVITGDGNNWAEQTSGTTNSLRGVAIR